MSDQATQPPGSAAALLDRHEVLRQRGLPTLSVLVGPPGSGTREWLQWAAGRGYVADVYSSADPSRLLPACVAALARRHDLRCCAVAVLARQSGRDPTD